MPWRHCQQDRTRHGHSQGYEAIYCVVDYHALTHVHDPEALRLQTLEMAAALTGLGVSVPVPWARSC